MDLIGFAIFYFKWIPYFKTKVSPWRNLIKSYDLDFKFPKDTFIDTHKRSCDKVNQYILQSHVLQWFNKMKPYYL